jgi:heavy metal sensor kinase
VRSIRLSLMICFLALLGVALGAVSVLVYRNTEQTLIAKKAEAKGRLEAEFKQSCEKERAQLEYALLMQARALVGQVEFQWPERRQRPPFFFIAPLYRTGYPQLSSLWLLSSIQAPNANFSTPFSLMLGTEKPLGVDLKRPNLFKIGIDEEEAKEHLDLKVAQYIQLDDNFGGTYKSTSLGNRALPFDPEQFQSEVDWRPADVVTLDEGHQVLRVILKVSPVRRIARSAPAGRPAPSGPPAPSSDRISHVKWLGNTEPVARPGQFIQCACDMNLYESAVARFQAVRDDELKTLEEQTDGSLSTLRQRLLLISLATFVATGLGGFWLVHLGLSPLRKLSVAVSRVSAKDFRLPFEERRVPREVEPIVARLNETLEMLKRAFAREKQAAADISHELRTPLAALLANVEVTLRKPRSSEIYREALEDCRASGQQMSHLVERLLALARLDAGVDMLRPQSVDAAEVAEQCASLVRPLAEARGLELRVHRNGPAILQADPAKLREVVTNLLHNAIQYNQPHGSVDLLVARQNGCLEVEVRDTGIGISAEARQHIFERFYRADPARSADGLHAGLGLAIVKGYVDLMGGSIAVESTEGKGSTFRVRLPAK